nr:hypothetical protein [Rhizobium aethiopicum]
MPGLCGNIFKTAPKPVRLFLRSSFEHYSETLREFGRNPDRDERAQHLADKFYVQEVLQQGS